MSEPTTTTSATTSPVPHQGGQPLVSSQGRTTVADPVVAKIAGMAAEAVSGVHALGGGASRAAGALRERIPGGRVDRSRGISVEVDDTRAAVDVELVAEYGIAILDLASAVRRNVIGSLERLTGLQVTTVDISVVDVHLPEENPAATTDENSDQTR